LLFFKIMSFKLLSINYSERYPKKYYSILSATETQQ
jgi:hypothetical protein